MQPSASERLKFIRERAGGISQQKLADILSIPISRIKDVESGKNNITVDLALRLEGYSNLSFKWIMTGQGKPEVSQITINDQQSDDCMIVQEHMNLVRGFIDKQRALNIDKELIELEKLAPEVFERIESYIKGSVDTLKAVTKKDQKSCLDRRRGERRGVEDPEQIPDGGERRSGTDRRKAS